MDRDGNIRETAVRSNILLSRDKLDCSVKERSAESRILLRLSLSFFSSSNIRLHIFRQKFRNSWRKSALELLMMKYLFPWIRRRMAFGECSRFIGSFCQRRDKPEGQGGRAFLEEQRFALARVSCRYYSREIRPPAGESPVSLLLSIFADPIINSSCHRELLPRVPPSGSQGRHLRGETRSTRFWFQELWLCGSR